MDTTKECNVKGFLLESAMVFAASAALGETQNYIPSAYRGVTEAASVMTSGSTAPDVHVEYGTKGIFTYINARLATLRQ